MNARFWVVLTMGSLPIWLPQKALHMRSNPGSEPLARTPDALEVVGLAVFVSHASLKGDDPTPSGAAPLLPGAVRNLH
jgi:hypothetical protein